LNPFYVNAGIFGELERIIITIYLSSMIRLAPASGGGRQY
jgi:hypothetical protein